MTSAHPPLHVVSAGQGSPLLLVHGSAADHTTWSIQLTTLQRDARMVTWDRRGHDRSPLPEGTTFFTVEQHADDAAALIARELGGPVVACGSSFGGVVVLELARRRPELLHGAVLIEPPLRPTDEERGIPAEFLAAYDRIEREQGGPAAAEHFLRWVLGNAVFERMPQRYQERSKSFFRQVRQDSLALGAYRVRYPELRDLRVPMLLLGGERSAPYFRPTLEALHASLGSATLELVPGAGHMLHAEAHRHFGARLLRFVEELARTS